MKILIAEAVHPILKSMLETDGHSVDFQPNISNTLFEQSASEFDGLVIRSKFKISREFLDVNKHLKFVARLGAGMENIDTEYAENLGITCLNSPEGNRDAVGEHTLGMLLVLMHNMRIADAQIRAGKWERNQNRGYEIDGKTIGIIGYGNMGTAFAQRLCGFGARVLAYDKYKTNYGDAYAQDASLDEIFEHADVLSVHVPLTLETEYMIDSQFLNKFKKNIYLLNAARGKVVKTDDLVAALESGKVLGAGLDVLEYEESHFDKLSFDELPPAFQYLQKSDNVILTPHIAGRTHESEQKLARVLAEKIVSLG